MANSISLSSGMKDVLIIESDGTVSFNENLAGNGVLISLDSKGSLTGQLAPAPPVGGGFVRPLSNAQWTLTYHEEDAKLFIIGIVDVDTNHTDGQSFPLSTGSSIQVQVDNNDNIGVYS